MEPIDNQGRQAATGGPEPVLPRAGLMPQESDLTARGWNEATSVAPVDGTFSAAAGPQDDAGQATATAAAPSHPMPVLGELVEVPLRDEFKHEAHVFTPWLAQHLSRLADVLHLGELALTGTEHRVGDFSIDILAETASGEVVVIENQLEQSDHGHLGQIITYAAGVGASVVVWVLPRLREEHRAALDWLNQNTAESLRFFGVEVSLVRIGDSPAAPMFAVEARPNDWQRQVRKAGPRRSAATSSTWEEGWSWLYEAIAAVPKGRWTSQRDLAELGGTSAGWVGRHLYGKWHLPSLHRVLTADGRPWQYFRWEDENDPRDVSDVLRLEGVLPPGGAAALHSRRLRADDLRMLVATARQERQTPKA